MARNLRIYEIKTEYIKYLSNYQKHIFSQEGNKDKRKYIWCSSSFETISCKYYRVISTDVLPAALIPINAAGAVHIHI